MLTKVNDLLGQPEAPDAYNPGNDPYIHTYSGMKMFYLRPDPSMVRIKDIAHALANNCRWTGHTEPFYSIAQHCALVSDICPAYPLRALLHDASEAYTGDINKPLKGLLGAAFEKIEADLEAAVFHRYSLGPMGEAEHKAVKKADMEIALAEAEQLLNRKMYVTDVKPAAIVIEPWTSSQAKYEFMERFMGLL